MFKAQSATASTVVINNDLSSIFLTSQRASISSGTGVNTVVILNSLNNNTFSTSNTTYGENSVFSIAPHGTFVPTSLPNGSPPYSSITTNGTFQPSLGNGFTYQLCVTNGKGFGQYREATYDSATRTLTLTEDWDIIPDSTSIIAASSFVEDVILWNNSLSGHPDRVAGVFDGASRGIQLYTCSKNIFIENNSFNDFREAVCLWGASLNAVQDPQWNVQIRNNTATDCVRFYLLWTCVNQDGSAAINSNSNGFNLIHFSNNVIGELAENTPSQYDTAPIGSLVNTVSQTSSFGGNGFVFENNEIQGVVRGFQIDEEATFLNILVKNNSFSFWSKGGSPQFAIASNSATDVMVIDNSFNGFENNYSGTGESSLYVPNRVIYLTSNDTIVPVELEIANTGISSNTFSIVSESSWITPVQRSITLNPEEYATITLHINREAVNTGLNYGQVKIIGSTQYVTIEFLAPLQITGGDEGIVCERDNNRSRIMWVQVKDAYVPAVTVCQTNLYYAYINS
jgi:hypothetical protein